MKFRVNYNFAIKGKLRVGSLILDAKDRKEAIKLAETQLQSEQDWYQLNSCAELKNKTLE